MRVGFTVGIYAARQGGDQEWLALTPSPHEIVVTGANETRLRENMVDRLRKELARAHPSLHERFHLFPGTRLERVHVDVQVRAGDQTRRIAGTFPLVCVPRWVDGEGQRLICFHPKLPARWFAATDAAEVADLAPHFARIAWADVEADDVEEMKSAGKDRLTTVSFTADPKSLLDDLRHKGGKQRAGASRSQEQVLFRLGVDLTAQAVNKTLAMGVPREPYRGQLQRLLTGARLRSTVLVGRPGVGKRTLLHRWIGDLLDDDGFALNRNLDRIRHVWKLSGKRIIAGMSYLGDWEKRCLSLADEARRTRAILWFEDLHLFGRIGQSRQSDRSLADFFRGPVQRGELTIVAALTAEQLARLEDDAPALASLLVRIPVHPAGAVETQDLLLAEVRRLEQRLPVDLHPFVPRTALELGAALFPWTGLPGAAIDLVRKVAEGCAPADGARAARVDVGPRDVVRHLARVTGLGEALLSPEEPLDPADVEAAFARRVMGQRAATSAATDMVMKVRAGVADPGRPLGVYLFTGPTGTGKTELATALAEYLYGDVSRLLRLDMSELSGPDAPARLIGDRGMPEGLLTQRIREQPFSVVLLDEIEKAHPSVLGLLLQLFDEGRLTDAAGNAASFAHAVVVMTSNLGARQQAPIGFGDHEAVILAEVARAVREFFPPELWNRIDRVVPFAPLSSATAARIVDKELQRLLARRGLRERSVFVYAGAAVKARAVAEAFDPRYGARTVKRWLEDRVGGLLADELAAGGTARMRVIRLIEQGGAPALHVEPMTEAPLAAGEAALAPLMELPALALEPHAAAAAGGAARRARVAVAARGRGRRLGPA
ncbi:MAG: ATP-dependent Clp protease ATP-binding subunit [Kofleriaceae bacterium]|nr:ATP-dependent Clp protease ATP-binding subunit [Kofleriaceae bacterium]